MQKLVRTGVLGQIEHYRIHEGRSTAIRRPDNTIDNTQIIEAQALTETSWKDLESFTLPQVLNSLRAIAEQFKEQRIKHLAESMNAVTAATGQQFDVKGRPLTNEDIFALIETMEVNFERDPTAGDMIIWAPSEMESVFRRLDQEMKDDPRLQKRWDDLMRRKRNDYREKEINRDLVG